MAHRFASGELLSSDVSSASRLDLLYTYGFQIPVPENTVAAVFSSATQMFHTGGHCEPKVVRYRNDVTPQDCDASACVCLSGYR